MLKLAVRLLVLGSAVGAVACAAASDVQAPAGAHVETLQSLRLVVHGTASASPAASCDSAPASLRGPSPVYVRINDEISGDITLRPTRGVAVLRVQELSTSRRWCAVTRDDGTGAVIEGEFPVGVFAISVEGGASADATPFEVVVERL